VILFAQPFVEERQQEMALERETGVYVLAFLHRTQEVRKVVDIFIEEAFLLDEVDEHQAIEHE